MGFIYNSDIYCDDCGQAILDELGIEGEFDGDSGDAPVACDETAEADSPCHCGGCGVFLENDLTSDGADYVRDAVREDIRSGQYDSVAITEWWPYYTWIAYFSLLGYCDECNELTTDLEDGFCGCCRENQEEEEEWCAEDFEDEPVDGDYLLMSSGLLGANTTVTIVGQGRWKEFGHDDVVGQSSDMAAVEAIRRRMDKEQFWPTIWIMSDHGNLSMWED